MTEKRTTRVALGALAVLGGLIAFAASFLPWLSAGTEDGGTTAITGWGGITGSSQIAGTNLNDVLNGQGSYRPGLIGLIFGVVAAVTRCGRRPSGRYTMITTPATAATTPKINPIRPGR